MVTDPLGIPLMYIQTFDVVASDTPLNEAYTANELPLHMDLGYYEYTPGLQFLHCLKYTPVAWCIHMKTRLT